MTLVPLIDRELRVAARRRATYRVRFFSALGVVAVWFFLFVTARGSSSVELSRGLFTAVGVLGLGFGLFAGAFLTADCLSEEKREGTIGLLFLTDLKAYDIVMAKVIANSIQSAYGLLASLPIAALPLLMGGVTLGEFWRVALAILATLLLSISWGVCVSALSREPREAVTRTIGGLLVVAGILPALWWLWFAFGAGGARSLLLWPSPVFTFRSAFEVYYRSGQGAHDFWCSLLLVLAMGVTSLALSIVILPRAWQEGTRGSIKPAGAQPRPSGLAAEPVQTDLRPGLLETDPAGWLALREAPPRKTGLSWYALLVGLWFCFLLAALFSSTHKEAFVGCLFTSVVLHWLLKYSVAVEATRQLSADHHSGALELLLATPLSEADILRGQTRALCSRFTGLLGLATALNLGLCWVVVAFGSVLSMSVTDRAIFFELFCGGILVLWCDFVALSSAGQWMALRARRHSRAILATLGRVMMVPWAGLFLLVFFMSQGRGISQNQLTLVFASWFALGFINAIAVAARAKVVLAGGFRRLLFEQVPRSEKLADAITRAFSPRPPKLRHA
jgi:ABC-type transport system involved in multi-copper enzyme maturation permease subunit